MNPAASLALLVVLLAVPAAAVARFEWCRRRDVLTDIGPDTSLGHPGCCCEACLDTRWLDAFGQQCDAEMGGTA